MNHLLAAFGGGVLGMLAGVTVVLIFMWYADRRGWLSSTPTRRDYLRAERKHRRIGKDRR